MSLVRFPSSPAVAHHHRRRHQQLPSSSIPKRRPIHASVPSPPPASSPATSPYPSLSAQQQNNVKPMVVVGSANADIYVEIDRLPMVGETISARTGQTLAGGKGANQACCGGKLALPLQVVRRAGVVLLQREIPDSVNIQVAEAAKSAGVPVILDAGGMEGPIPMELLYLVDIFSPNETELARLTGLPTETFEQLSQAVEKCYEMGVEQVLVKLGAKGSALFIKGEEPIKQPIIDASKVLDTTGAGDTFTAAFAVALVEGKTRKECLRFAAAAASLCVQVKGAIPSMPERSAVVKLLQSV